MCRSQVFGLHTTMPLLIWSAVQWCDVATFAGALAGLGVVAGDRVVVSMPMVPEAVIGMLACARLGAVHSVVFGGFAAVAVPVLANLTEFGRTPFFTIDELRPAGIAMVLYPLSAARAAATADVA